MTIDRKPYEKRASHSSTEIICPICSSKYGSDEISGVYAVKQRGYDDLLLAVLCIACAKKMHGTKASSPYRRYLRSRIKHCIDTHHTWTDEYKLSVGITSLKVVEYHGGNIAQALDLGWPFDIPAYKCNVIQFPDFVIVSNKETNHE